MNSKKLVLSALAIALLATSGLSFSREAAEGPRGEGKDHKNSVDATSMILAREATEGPRGEGKGHKNSVDATTILARRGADDPVPHPRGEGAGHPHSNDATTILARRGADDPVGSERPGEVHGQKRGGRNAIDAESFIIAREATEAPRGADNNNHRQRRGGRNSVEISTLA